MFDSSRYDGYIKDKWGVLNGPQKDFVDMLCDKFDGYAIDASEHANLNFGRIIHSSHTDKVVKYFTESADWQVDASVTVEDSTLHAMVAKTPLGGPTSVVTLRALYSDVCGFVYIGQSSNPHALDKFLPVMVTLSYDLNSATGTTPTSQTVVVNGTLTVAAEPTVTVYPEGMTAFDCWNTKADGTGTDVSAEEVITLTKSQTLYAKYKA